jgi:cytochrome d ubiquinol oxidase subunit I
MAGCGMLMFAVASWYWGARFRQRRAGFEAMLPRGLLRILVLCTPLGYVALEAGWVVTEVGRQPWVIYGVMRTADGVTPVTSVGGSLLLFALLYAGLLLILLFFLRRLAGQDEDAGRRASPRGQP